MGESIVMGHSHTVDLERVVTGEATSTLTYVLPNGQSFELNVTASDFEYAPRLVALLEEFARKCGFSYLTIRRASETDHTLYEWSEKLPN